jgi:hypothetical protein
MVLKRCVTTEKEVDGGDMEIAIRGKKTIRRGKKWWAEVSEVIQIRWGWV